MSDLLIDYDSLAKGDVIPVERVEELTGKKFGGADFDFALLRLRGRIEDALFSRSKYFAIRTEKGSIRILSDEDAAHYTHSEQVRLRASQCRKFALQMAVDATRLTADMKRQHERNIEINGKYMLAMQATEKQLKCTPHKRNVPGLPKP